MPNSTPLRYPGGKGRFLAYVEQLFTDNDMSVPHYVEPFCGGAGLALELLLRSTVSMIHLNDFDRAVYAFWYSVVNENDNLCRLIRESPCDMETWYRQRSVWLERDNAELLDLGFATFFLNRTNRSGILAAGVIGGKQQNGNWKIDARYNRDDLIARISAIGRVKEKIQIYNLDAREFLSIVQPNLPENSFVYLDPPYVEKGPGLYLNHYKEYDHRELATWVKSKLTVPWMVSYDDHPLIRECYGDQAEAEMNLPYSAYGNARRGSELVYFSNGLVVPQMVKRKKRFQQPWE